MFRYGLFDFSLETIVDDYSTSDFGFCFWFNVLPLEDYRSGSEQCLLRCSALCRIQIRCLLLNPQSMGSFIRLRQIFLIFQDLTLVFTHIYLPPNTLISSLPFLLRPTYPSSSLHTCDLVSPSLPLLCLSAPYLLCLLLRCPSRQDRESTIIKRSINR